jgi:HAD superfamily hydrolase (TIGR01509 family)
VRGVDLKGANVADFGAGSNFELIIFDCDGVLVDSELLSMRAYRDTLLASGIEIDRDALLDCVGLKQADIFSRIERLSGVSVPAAVRDDLWPRIRALFETELEPTVGLVDFLRSLRTKSCVASSSDPGRLKVSLGLTGLAGFFGDAVFSTQYVPHGKPAPDIYLFAAKRMGCDPTRCLVIEDSAPGIRGAIAANMLAIGYVGGAHIRAQHADLLTAAGARAVFAEWSGVSRWLAQKAPS